MRIPASVVQTLDNTRWAFWLVWQTNRWLAVGLAVVTITRAATPAGLAIFGRGIINATIDLIGSSPADLSAVFPWLVLGLVVTLAEAVSLIGLRVLLRRLQEDINLRVTTDILEHTSRLDLEFFEDSRSRAMIERAQQDIAGHIAQFVQQGLSAITSSVQALSLAVILFAIEPLVVFVVGALAVPYLMFQWRLTHGHYKNVYRRTEERRWTNYFVSMLANYRLVPEVKLLDLAPYFIEQFRRLIKGFRDEDRRLQIQGFFGGAILAIVATCALYALFIRVISRVLAGALTIGDIAVFGAASSRLRFSVEQAMQSISAAGGQALYISDLRLFLAVQPRRRHATGAWQEVRARGEVELDDVTFAYPGSSFRVLDGVSLRIRPGETVGLVGENGAGKSTLVKIICGLYAPDSGRVRLDGIDVAEIPDDVLHRRIAFVLQHFGRYEASAQDNVALGDWRRLLGDRAAVEAVARRTGIHDLLTGLPGGYSTMLGRMFGAHDLSGGQWQRIAFARALARDAALLILDEPTASLDARAEYELFSQFKELSKGRTTLLISHRFSTLSMANRLVIMDAGRIVESGTHEELLRIGGLYAKLYRLHLRLLNVVGDDPAP